MRVIDISWPVNEDTTTYKDNNKVSFEEINNYEDDDYRKTEINISSHTGTHVDAPSHFLENGENIESFGLDKLLGKAKVIDLTEVDDKIKKSYLLEKDIKEDQIVLFKTKNSELKYDEEFDEDFVYLSENAAEYLVRKNVKAVGTDYLGIEREQENNPTHKKLLEANIPIIEGLRLKNIPEEEYAFYCLPVKAEGIDASPARAILIDQ